MFNRVTPYPNAGFNFYNELIRSLPDDERDTILAELCTPEMVKQAQLLFEDLTIDKPIAPTDGSRNQLLAALLNFKLNKISIAQLATMHIFDSAVRTLNAEPISYLVYRYVGTDNKIKDSISSYQPLTKATELPTKFNRYRYDVTPLPQDSTQISDLPHRMQIPLMKRFFNFSDEEWYHFCRFMACAPLSEQMFNTLVAPEIGCYSSIISRVQKVLKCMRGQDYLVDSAEGFLPVSIMPIPSFTMFQEALNAKAYALGRNPVQLIPTYGYIEVKHYAELKTDGKIAFALYMPERNSNKRYQIHVGKFRTSLDGHPNETAFAGALHDVYHAMREMAMTEQVAKARMRLASIAKKNPLDKLNQSSWPVSDILIDGELIFSYPPSADTMFDPEYRPLNAEPFGKIFYALSLKPNLHEYLKRVFIEDMVTEAALWRYEFNLGYEDLLPADQIIYNQIKVAIGISNVVKFSNARAITSMGMLAAESKSETSDYRLAASSVPRSGIG